MGNQGKYFNTIEKSIKDSAEKYGIGKNTVNIIIAWLEFAYDNPSAFDPSVIQTRASLIEDSISISDVKLDS